MATWIFLFYWTIDNISQRKQSLNAPGHCLWPIEMFENKMLISLIEELSRRKNCLALTRPKYKGQLTLCKQRAWDSGRLPLKYSDCIRVTMETTDGIAILYFSVSRQAHHNGPTEDKKKKPKVEKRKSERFNTKFEEVYSTCHHDHHSCHYAKTVVCAVSYSDCNGGGFPGSPPGL